MFNVGDKVIANFNAPYAITTDGWTGYVIRACSEDYIYVSSNKNASVGENGVYGVATHYFELFESAKEREEKIMENLSEIITDEERRSLLHDMEALLSEYDYEYTEEALNKIINTWATNKADLIKAFKKHPHYLEGKFMIVFSHNFNRDVNIDILNEFKAWLLRADICANVRKFMPTEMRNHVIDEGKKLPNDVYYFLRDLQYMTDQYIDDETANKFNEIFADIRARAGQKMSRVVNKFLTYIGYNKLPDYNKEFAKYADAINPLQIVRHTILSVNPLDYLTMSFGNSWASCHTIDKENKRNMPNSYEGMYSSGTVSYMLDAPSMVFYTVDASYDGNDFWNEPKINRQMFHWGEEKLVQGRLYPQDNDYNNSTYTPYREIVQSIMSELFEFPNLWTVSKGTGAAGRYVCSEGTHYRDYDNYDNCTLSRVKGSENEKCITVGHVPICIKCGDKHYTESNISCCKKKITCSHCGCVIDEEYDEVRWIDGDPYCDDCTFYCDSCDEWCVGEATEVRGGHYVCSECLENCYSYCEGCEEYVRNGDATYVESEGASFCDECLEENFRICDDCGEYHRFRNLTEYVGRYLCPSCLEEAKENEEDVVNE